MFYLIFKLIGLEVTAEVRTNRGRIDAVVEVETAIFLFEFKLDGRVADALAQIQEREYIGRYQGRGKPLLLVGVNFFTTQHGVAERQVA